MLTSDMCTVRPTASHPPRQGARRGRALLTVAVAGLLASAAMADDTLGSWHDIDIDAELVFAAHGDLVINKTAPIDAGINTGKDPDPVWLIKGNHWWFEIWFVVDGWTFPGVPAGPHGAHNTRIGIRGEHTTAPHPKEGEKANSALPARVSEKGANIVWGTGAGLAVSAAVKHEGGHHWDTYKVSSDAFANDVDPRDPASRRHIGPRVPGRPIGGFNLEAKHVEKSEGETERADATLGSSPKAGTTVTYDPALRVLRLDFGEVDILDADGGRSGGIAADYAEDPLVGMRPEPVVMEYAGFDPEHEAHLFKGGGFAISNPEAEVQIGGQLAELCLTSTVPGAGMGNFGMFDPIWVTDTADPAAWPSAWADRFVQQGWFGEGLSPTERAQRLFPVLTFSTDIDLVEATRGFTEPVRLPATALLTIAIDPEAAVECYADCDGSGELDIFDFLCFQNAFATGDPRADCDGSGELDIFDFLCFQNAFATGCP